MNYLFFIAISIIIGSIKNLSQRVLMRDREIDPKLSMVTFQFLGVIFVFLFSLATGNFQLSNFSTLFQGELLYYVIANGFLYSFGSLYTFKALQEIEVSKFTVLFSLQSVIIVTMSTLFLNEVFTPIQVLGLFLVLLAILIVVTEDVKQLLHFKKGEIYALIAALGFGLGATIDKAIIDQVHYLTYLVVGFFTPGIIVLLSNFSHIIKKVQIYKEKKNFFLIILFTFLYVASGLTYFESVTLADSVSLVSSIGQISVIATVILGIIFLRERDRLAWKIVGSVISFLGLLLLV
jgi:uncharacterized membrane protein